MNNGEKNIKVNLSSAKEQVEKVSKRIALLHLAYAKTIIAELGEEKGEKLVLKAIKNYGRIVGYGVKERVNKQGLENKPENYQEDLPKYGMHEKIEQATVQGEKGRRSYGCVMGKLWQELGEGRIGRLYCYVDPAKYMAYNPDFALVHTKCIPDGGECCEFKIRKTTEQERKDFADDEKDWSYIDK